MEHVAQQPIEMENEAQIARGYVEKGDGLGTSVDSLDTPMITRTQCSDVCQGCFTADQFYKRKYLVLFKSNILITRSMLLLTKAV